MNYFAYMPSEKWEFPPLLGAGLHSYTLDGIRELCVTPFPLTRTREAVFSGLSRVVTLLTDNRIVGDVWIDGGFMTTSINPPDADLVVCLESAFVSGCNEAQRAALDGINFEEDQDTVEEFLCHSYLSIVYPEGHEQWQDGSVLRARWRDWFGYSRRPRRIPKGIAVINLDAGPEAVAV